MYAIEYFVGSKFGGWHRGDDRFMSPESAMRRISRDEHDEKKTNAEAFLRRCVRVSFVQAGMA